MCVVFFFRVQLRVEAAADLQRHGRGVPEHPGQAAGRAVQGERGVTGEHGRFVLNSFLFADEFSSLFPAFSSKGS